MSSLLLTWILATHPTCPPGQMLLGVDAAGHPQCGTWKQLQARSRTGGGPVIRLPAGALKRPSPSTYVVARSAVSALVRDGLGGLAGQARIEPTYAEGKRIGFRLSRIRSGSVIESLGLRNGDLLIDVNGADLGNPVSVLTLYALIFRANAKATLNIRRKGKPRALVWRIEG